MANVNNTWSSNIKKKYSQLKFCFLAVTNYDYVLSIYILKIQSYYRCFLLSKSLTLETKSKHFEAVFTRKIYIKIVMSIRSVILKSNKYLFRYAWKLITKHKNIFSDRVSTTLHNLCSSSLRVFHSHKHT